MSPSVRRSPIVSAPDPMQLSLFAPLNTKSEPPTVIPTAVEAVPPPTETLSVSAAVDGHDEPAPLPTSAAQTLADVLLCLERSDRRDRKNGNMRSAVRTLGKVLGAPLDQVPCAPVKLWPLMNAAMPARVRLTPGRWTAVRSLVRFALIEARIKLAPGRDTRAFAPEWAALNAQLPSQGARAELSRVFHFLTREAISPSTISQHHLEAFRTTLLENDLHRKPEQVWRAAMRRWNKAATGIAAWPKVRVELARDPRHYSLPLDEFPASFVEERQRFLSECSESDELSDDYNLQRARPGTVDMRRKQIHQIASALALSGFPIVGITGLSVLTEPPNAKAALTHLRSRKGGKTTTYIGQQAHLLCTIGRHWVHVSPEDQRKLQGYAKKVEVPSKGMGARTRARLRQFDIEENLQALLNLPDRVCREVVKTGLVRVKQARLFQRALAVEMLIMTPIRIGNLAMLELGVHLHQTQSARASTWHIDIPAHLTKNRQQFEAELPLTTRPPAGHLHGHDEAHARSGMLDLPVPWAARGRPEFGDLR